MDEVRDLRLRPEMSAKELIYEMKEMGGFVGRYMAEGYEILKEMVKDEGCLRFLSFPASVMATGLRGVLVELVKRKLFDVVITTCGTLDHDLCRSWGSYYKGDFMLDDVELYEKGYHRIGSVLVKVEDYGPALERRIQPFLEEIYERKKVYGSYEICELLGGLTDEGSFLYWCRENGIPVVVPGIYDGALGSQLWLSSQRHRDFKIDLSKDEDLLAEKVFGAKRSGALIVGGGISKHHTIWWNQFKDGLDYAVYITTAVEEDGSLSGARTREAISWGKVKPRAKRANIFGEATAILPWMVLALIQELEG